MGSTANSSIVREHPLPWCPRAAASRRTISTARTLDVFAFAFEVGVVYPTLSALLLDWLCQSAQHHTCSLDNKCHAPLWTHDEVRRIRSADSTKEKTHSINHASDTHQMKMRVVSRRLSLKLNSSGAKIFGWMLVTNDGKVVQRTDKWLWTQSKNKTEANNSTLIRPSDLRPRDTVQSSEQVRCNSASHNWLCTHDPKTSVQLSHAC